MKHVFLLIVFSIGTACTSIPVSASQTLNRDEVVKCIEDQIRLYSDLCAEERDDQASNSEVHFDGVNCAADSIKICLNLPHNSKDSN